MGVFSWTALTSGSHTRLWEHVNNLANAVAAAFVMPAGRAAKTNLFQSLSGGAAITLAADSLRGGMTFDSANGGGLKVPEAGLYAVTMSFYVTGAGSGAGEGRVRRWRAGAQTSVMVLNIAKTDGSDYASSRTELLDLQANDILTLYGTANASTWGDSGRVGTTLSVWKV